MTCPACGTDNEPGRKFCSSCGVRLRIACPRCDTSNDPGARFCGECGATARLDGRGPRCGQSHATASGDRRPRSLSGASSRSCSRTWSASRRSPEDRDPEDVRELLTRYFDLAREVIERYGGTIEKFIGDAVMAVWGAPTAHEDDAERAVRAGARAGRGGPRPGARPATAQARAGVLTGEAAVTLGAVGQGMVAGDLVNTASRLQSVAPPGHASWSARRPTGPPAGRSPSSPPASSCSRARPRRSRPGARCASSPSVGGAAASDGLEAPFVGRDEELRLLKDLLHATARERRPRLVSVIGQAGIGKSRLAWEFQKYIDGVVEHVYWHQGRSPAYGEGITFWALGEMVRKRAGLAEGDDEATTRDARSRRRSTQYVPDEDERRWIEPRLLQLLGLDELRGRRPRRAVRRVAHLLRAHRRARAPTVLVFEDLQWADQGLLDFIDHLLDWSREPPDPAS